MSSGDVIRQPATRQAVPIKLPVDHTAPTGSEFVANSQTLIAARVREPGSLGVSSSLQDAAETERKVAATIKRKLEGMHTTVAGIMQEADRCVGVFIF